MKTNRFFLFFTIAICIIAGCTDNLQTGQDSRKVVSHEVTLKEAHQQLNKIIPDFNIPATRNAAEKSVPQITSSYSIGSHSSTRSDGEIKPYFHIFNFGDNEGFAIMSGDDRVIPLLAITFSGELTPETEIDNPGFKIAYSRMEDYYVEQVSSFSSNGGTSSILPIDPGSNPELELHSEYSTPIIISHDMPYGHCQVRWGQKAPYNKYCGLYELGLDVYAGCVPVSVAQLMSIYKYPNSYNGHSFDWNEMNQFVHNSYSHQYYAAAIDQIARLMQQLGLPQNLDVQYEVVEPGNGSSADPDNIPRTLRHLGYSNGGTLRDYNTEDIANELKAGYPVLIGGYDDTGVGHQWLGHGITEFFRTVYVYNGFNILVSTINVDVKYILCNWGWSGSQDGYYASNVFDTNKGPTDIDSLSSRTSTYEDYYRHDLKMVINIRK